MKTLAELDSGSLFQFNRQSDSNIYMAINPTEGTYRRIGKYVQASPQPPCQLARCVEHSGPVKIGKPQKLIKVQKINVGSPLYQWMVAPHGTRIVGIVAGLSRQHDWGK